jgi:hypothetical protein
MGFANLWQLLNDRTRLGKFARVALAMRRALSDQSSNPTNRRSVGPRQRKVQEHILPEREDFGAIAQRSQRTNANCCTQEGIGVKVQVASLVSKRQSKSVGTNTTSS